MCGKKSGLKSNIEKKGIIGHSPIWAMIVGIVFVGISVLFLIILITFSLYGKEVPDSSRPLIVFVFSSCMAMGSGFLGGYASAEGKIPFSGTDDPIAFGLGGGVAVLFLLMVTSNWIYPFQSRSNEGDLTPSEKTIAQLHSDIMTLRGTWETIREGNKTVIEKVFNEAPKYADLILKVDRNINLGHMIDKYQYAAYAYMMAADVSSKLANDEDSERKDYYERHRNDFIDNGIKCADLALKKIDTAFSNFSSGVDPVYTRGLIRQINDYYDRERTLFLKSMLLANDSLTRRKYPKSDAITLYNSIDQKILEEKLLVIPESSPWIGDLIKERKGIDGKDN